MSLLSAWALAGLLLSVPLVLLHLRRRKPPVREVSSLLAWRHLQSAPSSSSKRLGAPLLPLLLALQLLALALIVLALARPASGHGGSRSGQIWVVDDSIWMQAREGSGDRLEQAHQLVLKELARLPADAHVSVVLAAAEPSLLFSGSAGDAASALRRLTPTYGPSDLTAGLRLAAGLRERSDERIVLLRAPEDAAPGVRSSPAQLSDQVVGASLEDVGFTDAGARCGLPGASSCELFARVFDTGTHARQEHVEVLEDGRQLAAQTLAVNGESSSPLAFDVPAGRRLELRIAGGDALVADDSAFVAVPSPATVHITLVGSPAQAGALARGLLAYPGTAIRLVAPARYRPSDASTSDLLVLDRVLPDGRLPRSPALLLVDPPSLPGGSVEGALSDSRISGSDDLDGLLAGVDLTSLTIGAGQARHLQLPASMTATAWSAAGPLIAAGSAEGQRVAVLAFDPSSSNLPQLPSFPLLISNIIEWSQRWAPSQARAGEALLVQQPAGTTETTLTENGQAAQRLPRAPRGERVLRLPHPGLFTIGQSGPWGTRSTAVAVNADVTPVPASPAVTLNGPAPVATATGTPWWPWLLSAGLLALLLEWLYGARREREMAVS